MRIRVGQGIAGAVAASGTPINIPDAYADSRFNAALDRDTGFRTQHILAFPVRDSGDKVVGVLQVINKRSADGSAFNATDEEILSMLSGHAGVALRNAHVYESATRAEAKTRAMLGIVRALHDDTPSAASLMFTITTKTQLIVEAERCTLFLADHAHSELWAIQGDVDLRVPMDKGIAGLVATRRATLRIDDAYTDSRWSGHDFDARSGYRTRSILCMPLISHTRDEVVGVVQCINKQHESGQECFTAEDEEVLGTLLALVTPIIERSPLFRQRSHRSAEVDGTEFSGRSIQHHEAALAAESAQPAIVEGDEEEDDDEA